MAIPPNETPDQRAARELSVRYPMFEVRAVLGGFVASPLGAEVFAGMFSEAVEGKIRRYLSQPNPREVVERLSWLGADELDPIMAHVYAILDLGDVLPRDLYEDLYVFGLQVVRSAAQQPRDGLDYHPQFENEKD